MENTKNNFKVFFIDLDGTLLDIKNKNGHDVSQANLDALKEANKKGIHTIISTGRSGPAAKKFLDKIDYTYAVTGNGSIILKKDKVIKSLTLSKRQLLLTIDFAKKHKLLMKTEIGWNAYGAFGPIQSYLTKKMGFTPVKHFNIDTQKDYHKFVLWGRSKKKMMMYIQKLQEIMGDLSIAPMNGGYILEITQKEATKGNGNLFIAEKLGITKKSEMAHIGDSMNDYTVVGKMNVIAMKNSSKKLLAEANYIGPSYKGAGVAKILNGQYKTKS